MRLQLSILTKLVILVFTTIVATALAVNQVYLRGSEKILTERAIVDLKGEVSFFRYPLTSRIERVRNDVQLLSELPTMRSLLRAIASGGADPATGRFTDELKRELGAAFLEVLRTRRQYRRVRLIGVADGGRDIVRADRFGDRIEVAPAGGLRRSGEDIAFQVSLRMASGEVHLSEPSLEREDGQLLQPHTLVMSAGTPLRVRENEVLGVLRIALDFGEALKQIGKSLPGGHQFYLTNAVGDYLINPDRSKLFASDLGHDHRIYRDQPALLSVMNDPKRDDAVLMPEDRQHGNVLTFQKIRFDPLNSDSYFGIAIQAPYSEIIGKTLEVEQQGYMMSALIALIAGGTCVLVLRLLMRPLHSVAAAVVRYRNGEKDVVLPADSPDEIGTVAREFGALIRQKGDEEWIRESLVTISRGMLGYQELKGFAHALMEAVTAAAGAQVGVLYISSGLLRPDEADDTPVLTCVGAWGYRALCLNGAVDLPAFRWGEGMVGSCARSGKRLLIGDIPDGHMNIVTGIGETRPRQLLLIPVVCENTMVGVMELATVGRFTDVQFTLLEQLSFNVGFIIKSIVAGERTKALLEEARRIAEELRRNQEELHRRQEELAASNEKMEEKNRILEEQNQRIRHQSAQLKENRRLIQQKVEELERSNKYKSEFLANMSHELRTPLNSLLILARSLAANEDGNLTPEQMEEARVIHNGGLELLSLINDVLDLSKVEAGRISVFPEIIRARDVARRLGELFRPVAQEKGVALAVQIDDSVPDILRTDGQRLEQILKNLLSNAIKFTKTGTVTLRIHRPQEGGAAPIRNFGPSVAFSVIDTGIGIEKSKLEEIFEAFQQEDGSIDRQYGGTGLGLTIARKLARLLGGEIHVASDKGAGSTFTLFLPLSGLSEQTAPAPSSAMPAISRRLSPDSATKPFLPDDRATLGPGDKVVLIIDDDASFARALMKLARQRGYKSLAAGDGKTGLMLAAEHRLTAILLDLMLPDLDGMRVLDQLKQDLATRHVPVHIITGADAVDAVMPLSKGAIGLLMKPAQPEQLDTVFRQIAEASKSTMKRVLVVEDDHGTQTAVQKLLKSKAIEVIVAASGGAAFELMQKDAFDCIILDLSLPDMTGFEWLEAAARATGPATPPIVIYTARDLSDAERQLLSRHTGSVVTKGVSSTGRLLDKVTLFLHGVEAGLSQEQQAVIRAQHDPDQALSGRTVLLADDDLRNSFALSKLLRKHGMNIVIADNGQMALDKLREEAGIELVIMDIMMPVMNGYQAMQAIRSEPAWRDLPIIALTARAMPEEQEQAIQAGANDYLVKPVDIDRLLTLMRIWLFRQDEAA